MQYAEWVSISFLAGGHQGMTTGQKKCQAKGVQGHAPPPPPKKIWSTKSVPFNCLLEIIV